MKKHIIILSLCMLMFTSICQAKSVYNDKTNAAMKMYKSKNYSECMQVMHEVIENDPSNVLAYYYIAMSQARLGDLSKAKEAYQRVIDLNSSTQLSKLSKNGIECLEDKTKCRSEYNLDPTKKAMDAVNAQIEEKKIQSVKDIVNRKQNIQEVPVEYLESFKDFSDKKNQIQNKKSAIPTKDEIADAFDVLRRAGYQNIMPQQTMSPEMIQMSMLGYSNPTMNGQYSMGYLPYMMGMNGQQIDPQFMQTMMMTSMIDGMYQEHNK